MVEKKCKKCGGTRLEHSSYGVSEAGKWLACDNNQITFASEEDFE